MSRRRWCHPARRAALLVVVAVSTLMCVACGKESRRSPVPGLPARTYRMGFMGISPRPDLAVAIQALELWTRRADAAVHHVGVPWDSLLAGVFPETLATREIVPIVNYYRSKGLRIVMSLDPTNGLDRASDAPELVALGRSLTEPSIQALFRSWCVGVNQVVNPDWLQVASETNLIRAIAPAALYAAVVATANGAATEVRALDPTAKLAVSVQVEIAWGGLVGSGTYVGIARDLADFGFIQGLGLSSYPYFVESDPDSLPLDYYSRLAQGTSLPVFVVEGGWSSVTVTSFPGTPQIQARYIRRHAQLLDAARALYWFQLTFTDLDPAFFPPGANLTAFAYNGLVDDDLVPKPALAEWDAQWARPVAP